jgi:hypothetical protein
MRRPEVTRRTFSRTFCPGTRTVQTRYLAGHFAGHFVRLESRQIFRHFGGIAKSCAPALGILPFILPKWQVPLPGDFVRLARRERPRHQLRHGVAIFDKLGDEIRNPDRTPTLLSG